VREILEDDMKKVYLFDKVSLRFQAEYLAQPSPLEQGQYIVPEASTDIVPPAVSAQQFAQWNGSSWEVIDIPVPPPHVPTQEEIAAAAQAAQDLADRQETQADAKFRALTSKSPAQVKAWVRNRFPTLTLPEQDDLATIVQVVGILARRL
jgi:hypothetical protein